MGGLVCHQLGFLSEEREDREGEERVVVEDRECTAKGSRSRVGAAGGDPRMLEEVAAGVHSGPHTGWGGWPPPCRPPCSTPCSWPGVGGGGRLSPGVLWALTRLHREPAGHREPRRHRGVPSGSRGQGSAQSHALGKRPRANPQINQSPLGPQMERCCWGSCLSLGRGWCCRRPQPGWQKCGPHFPPGGHFLGPPCPFFLPKKRFTTLPFWVGVSGPHHLWMLVPPTQRRSSQGQVEGWKRPGTPSASRRRAGQRELARSGVRSLELGRQESSS